MKSEFLAQSPLLILPLFAFFLFLSVFLTVFFTTMSRKAASYSEVERLPMNGDES